MPEFRPPDGSSQTALEQAIAGSVWRLRGTVFPGITGSECMALHDMRAGRINFSDNAAYPRLPCVRYRLEVQTVTAPGGVKTALLSAFLLR